MTSLCESMNSLPVRLAPYEVRFRPSARSVVPPEGSACPVEFPATRLFLGLEDTPPCLPPGRHRTHSQASLHSLSRHRILMTANPRGYWCQRGNRCTQSEYPRSPLTSDPPHQGDYPPWAHVRGLGTLLLGDQPTGKMAQLRSHPHQLTLPNYELG